MPLFTLHRNFSMATTKGHVVTFKKAEPTWVPPVCVPDAVAIGAVPVEANKVEDVLGPEKPQPVVMTPEEREAQIFKAFDQLLMRNQRGDFTASGLPHPKKLESLIGYELSNKERDDYWQRYNQKKAEEALQ